MPSKQQAEYSFNLLFDPEDGGNTFLRNVDKYLLDYTASNPRRYYSSRFKRIKLTIDVYISLTKLYFNP
jgi:hypothetical protein